MSTYDNLFNLKDKTAIVTGAAGGLGEAIALAYSEYDSSVVLVDIDEGKIDQLAQQIAERGGRAISIKADVSKAQDVKRVVERTLSEFGRVDILMNNAGIGRRANAEQMTDQQWDEVLEVNLKGAFLFCREVGKVMIKHRKGGRIINMASIAGVVGITTGNANYAASKGGLIAMTRCLAIEWAKHNILVNAIAPTHTHTPLVDCLIEQRPEVEKYFIDNIPLGRMGYPSDLVGPAVFLASEASSFITGHVLLVDGGHTAK